MKQMKIRYALLAGLLTGFSSLAAGTAQSPYAEGHIINMDIDQEVSSIAAQIGAVAPDFIRPTIVADEADARAVTSRSYNYVRAQQIIANEGRSAED